MLYQIEESNYMIKMLKNEMQFYEKEIIFKNCIFNFQRKKDI